MKRWTHPQDFIALLAGIYAFLSPIWTTTTGKATTTMIVLGILTAAIAVIELVRTDLLPAEGATALLGVLFFISPWVMSFSGTHPMAWTAWIVGAITFLVGAADLQITRSHRGHATTPTP
jgi:uncharacterized membrane protein HdeD (DUF308 family)